MSIAAVNGPTHAVVSGPAAAVSALTERFTAAGTRVQPLTVSHAFHSSLMEPMLERFAAVARDVAYRPAQIGLVSNVSGRLVGDEVCDPGYWVRHVRQPVRFAAGVATLVEAGADLFVEAGPHPVLLGMARAAAPEHAATWVPSLRRNADERREVLGGLGAAYAAGAAVTWSSVGPIEAKRLELPTYPFERQSHWLVPARRPRSAAGSHPLLGTRTRVPALGATVFETELGADGPVWVGDHRLAGTAVFPGTGYLEMVVAATADGPDVVESLAIREPLVLPDGVRRTVQTVVTGRAGGRREVQVSSTGPEGEEEVVHARAVTAPAGSEAGPPPRVEPAVLLDGLTDDIDVAAYVRAPRRRRSHLRPGVPRSRAPGPAARRRRRSGRAPCRGR